VQFLNVPKMCPMDSDIWCNCVGAKQKCHCNAAVAVRWECVKSSFFGDFQGLGEARETVLCFPHFPSGIFHPLRDAPSNVKIKCKIVAVGTTIADRPRTDPYVRVYAYGSSEG
jgi:hypothetical protein